MVRLSRSGITLAIAVLVALVGVTGQAVASHAGAIANCGDAGTFTVKAAQNSGGFQSPFPTSVILFEEGGVLTANEISRDGQLLLSRADTGRNKDALTEITCSFTTGSDGTFTVTGIFVPR